MPVEQPSPGYSSFLLRLRRVGTHPAIWHVSLQDVRTGEWHQFMDLAQLFAFIEQIAAGNSRSIASETPDP